MFLFYSAMAYRYLVSIISGYFHARRVSQVLHKVLKPAFLIKMTCRYFCFKYIFALEKAERIRICGSGSNMIQGNYADLGGGRTLEKNTYRSLGFLFWFCVSKKFHFLVWVYKIFTFKTVFPYAKVIPSKNTWTVNL